MKVDKNLASINVAKEVQKELLARGLGAAFKPLKNIEEAREKFKETHAKQTSVHMEIIEPFITATMNTLETQVSMKVKKEKPYLIGAGPDLQIDIAGLVNLVSPQFTGAVAVCFPKDTFLGMSPLN